MGNPVDASSQTAPGREKAPYCSFPHAYEAHNAKIGKLAMNSLFRVRV